MHSEEVIKEKLFDATISRNIQEVVKTAYELSGIGFIELPPHIMNCFILLVHYIFYPKTSFRIDMVNASCNEAVFGRRYKSGQNAVDTIRIKDVKPSEKLNEI